MGDDVVVVALIVGAIGLFLFNQGAKSKRNDFLSNQGVTFDAIHNPGGCLLAISNTGRKIALQSWDNYAKPKVSTSLISEISLYSGGIMGRLRQIFP